MIDWVGSRDRFAGVERRLVPSPLAHDAGKDCSSSAHVVRTEIKRRETEPHDIGRTKITDHALGDQGLHDGVPMIKAE